MKKMIIAVVIAALAAGGWYLYSRQSQSGLPEGFAQSNGRLELNRFDIASLYPGRVQAVLVDEGSEVKEGDALVELSSVTSTSQLEAAKAQKQRAQEAVARADAEIKAYEQQQKVAQMELGNAQNLKRDELVSPAEVTKRLAARDGAAASVRAARAARAEAMAAVAAAQAQINQAASANDDMTIRSPKAGRVEYKIAEVGSVIAAGSKVVSLLDPMDVSMNIFLPNAQAGRLKVGDEARIVLDSVDAVFPAKISFIATEAQFTPKSVETENEREKLMFKVKLKITPETASRYNRLLKGGMTGNGYVRTDAAQTWPSELAVKLPH
ncbi:HlyD family secretion protein [Neisseria sp. 83E34]|uniref:HlyD family secretion protein n=1 Tax=Neisseria sp. 83E34 TaxID=1692264 RepID=UPI0006CE8A08|nr:HlyD family efflux transporter periplasmic adaptor subunit [Neisseria sp. 83E34]KPN72133.1 acriflavin resistance protein [Neisseria sp. 83E34]